MVAEILAIVFPLVILHRRVFECKENPVSGLKSLRYLPFQSRVGSCVVYVLISCRLSAACV